MASSVAPRILAATALLALAGCATLPPAETSRPVTSTPAPGLAPAPQPSGKTGWGFPIYDIPADPSVRFLTLDNGLKVAVLRNSTPQGTAAIRFGFDVGMVDETPEEAGLAHFLEHMAFNGSTNVPEGEMIKLLEREGLAFGADTNASTGLEDTIYKLDLPRADSRLLDTALMLMRETASELSLAPAAIDRERGVIQSETRTRNTYARRRLKDYFDFVAPETAFAQRLFTEGENANIDSFRPETMAALYRRWYRPDNATLVVVGDFDPAATEAAIRTRFASWQAPTGAIPDTDEGRIDLARPIAARNFVDPGVPVIVTIDSFWPNPPHLQTEAEFRRRLLLDIGTAVLDRRLAIIANSPNAPILGGNADTSDFFELSGQSSTTLQARETPDGWRDALRVGETEIRRLATHGITEAELKEQLANITTRYRTAAEQEATRRNPQLAESILGTVQRETLVVTPSTWLALLKKLAPGITPEAVLGALKPAMTGSAPLIHVSTKAPIAGGAETILAAWKASQALPVEAPRQAVALTFGYSDFGTPGAIAADATIADLGIRQIRFANNVRLNLKRTEFETGKLRFAVRFGAGTLAIPKERIGEAIFLSSMSGTAGTGKHSLDELQQILAGRQIAYGFSVAEDSFVTRGTTTMADFATQMQVSAAYVSDPGYRPEAFAKWQGLVPAFVGQIESTPDGVAQANVPRLVANGDPRFGIPTPAEMTAVRREALQADLAPQLSLAPVEISVVGDFDVAQVVDAVARTFGALPARQATLGDYSAARQARFATSVAPATFTHGGAPDQALVQVYWPARDDSDPQAASTLSLLAEVFGLELIDEVREKLGATYSPQAGADLSDTFTGFGTLSTSIVVAPKDADAVLAAVDAITRRLREAPIDPDLLARARRPILERVSLNRRENGWWLQVLGQSQLRADRLDRYRTLEARLNAVTPAMLEAAAKQYLVPGKALKVRIVPRPAG